jgi:RiboL-PSP-HEPN
MRYQVTRARNDFELAVKDIVRRVKLAGRAGTLTEFREYTVAAAIFLAHAEIENYVSDSIDSFASLFSKRITSGSKLPPELRTHLFLSRANVATVITKQLAGAEELQSIKTLTNAIGGPPGSFLNDSVPLATFTGADIYTKYKYPSKRNIEKLLARIGVAKGGQNLNRVARRDVVSLLESLGELRTALAHSAGLPGLGCSDIAERILETTNFVRAFDRLLYEQAKKWNVHLHWASDMR